MKTLICKQELRPDHPLQKLPIMEVDTDGFEYVQLEYDRVECTDGKIAGRHMVDGREVWKWYNHYYKDGVVVYSQKNLGY